MRKALTNALVLLVTLAVMLIASEAVVRTFFKEQSVLFPRYHTDYQYGRYTLRGIRPSTEFWHTSADGSWKFVTNSRGLRNDHEFVREKPAGVLRVLSLGDSHTQGYEVRQSATFSAVLERWLNARGAEGNMRAEVMNAGVSGFSTAEELAFLENEGHWYKPDVVVVGFYANDFADNVKADLFALDTQGALVERKHEHLPGVKLQNLIYSIPGVPWVSENSYFYNILFNGVWVFFKDRLKQGAFEMAVGSNKQSSSTEVDLTLALLERMKKFTDGGGMRLIVVDIPERPGPFRFASSMPQPFREALGKAGIEVVDAGDLLGRFDGAAEFHLPRGNQHISELTHALIGVELGRRILKEGPAQPLVVGHR